MKTSTWFMSKVRNERKRVLSLLHDVRGRLQDGSIQLAYPETKQHFLELLRALEEDHEAAKPDEEHLVRVRDRFSRVG